MGGADASGAPAIGPRRVSRRDFVRWSAAAGIGAAFAGMGALAALGVVKGPEEPVPDWELRPGVVDYSRVLVGLGGSTPNVLKIAQWYDYWPGSFLLDFKDHMRNTYGLTVETEWDIYTSNEELFHWITLSKRRYDVIFPSNYLVDLMKKANMIYTLNPDWLPNLGGANFSNILPGLAGVPAENPYDRRQDAGGAWVSVPYFWGTTGLGFRTDRIPKEEVEEVGYDLMWMPSYTPRDARFPAVDLQKRMRMLDDERDVIGAGLKKVGWDAQKDLGWTPTGVPHNPDPPYGGVYQWTTNEVDPAKVNPSGEALLQQKPLLFAYDSVDQASSLIAGSAVLNQGWSGDMMYAIRPDQATVQPVDYVIPPQGSTWWVDCAAIHSKSRNLWLAHEFLNFIHDTQQNITLTKWNLYATPNASCFDALTTNPYPNGWNVTQDERLYPNLLAPDTFRLCDLSQDVGLDNLLRLYNPLWFDLATV